MKMGSIRGESPAADLAAARKIITHETGFTQPDGTTIKCSYQRRMGELDDAERVILGS